MGQVITLRDLRQELPDKQKTIDDIIRFIRNRNEDNPNYSLLLGSGASVSSGIASGGALTDQWRKEIYSELSEQPISKYNLEEATTFLQSKHSKWYDTRNEYASLFEYKYNLPKQRRIFVEQEVANKVPSIGYAYLVRLVEKGYFRTIFTTNFDDLLNYAFYAFSTICRPIVCAHDSSITSITVTSKRPKIIKLHGDYLFDDIKCTNRETESLEDNMKSKFVEFAKDYGLIVVGYGGNDRSILDVLNYLLKHEDYFGHGIYWCVRDYDETIINEEVRKLLWKDRVYYVPISGFDELFAEISNKVTPKTILPYETKIGVDVMEVINEIHEGEKIFSSCKYITSDLNDCKKNIQKAALSNQRKVFELTSDETTDEAYASRENFEEIIKKQKIEEKIIGQQYTEAIAEATQYLEGGLKNHSILTELHAMISFCYQKLNDNIQAISILRKLIDINNQQKKGDNTALFHRIAVLTKNIKSKIDCLEEAIKFNPSDYKAYYSLAEAYIKQKEESLEEQGFDPKVTEYLNISIKKNPSHLNYAHYVKFNFLLEQAESSEDFKKCEDVLVSCSSQDEFDEDVVDSYVSLLTKKKAKATEIIEYINRIKQKSPRYAERFTYDMTLLNSLNERGSAEDIKTQMLYMDKEYSANSGSKSFGYYLTKSSILLDKFRNLDLSIQCLQDALKLAISEKDTFPLKAALISKYIYSGEVSKVKTILDDLPKVYEERKNNYEIDYYAELNDFNTVIELFEKIKLRESFLPSREFYMSYSYNLLKAHMYDKVIEVLRPILEHTHYSDDVLVINYELARKLNGETPKYQRLQKIQQKSKSDKTTKAAATILLSKHHNQTDSEYKKACDLIKEAIEEDYSKFYSFQRFPVFKDIPIDSFALSALPYELGGNTKLQLVTPSAA